MASGDDVRRLRLLSDDELQAEVLAREIEVFGRPSVDHDDFVELVATFLDGLDA